MTLTIKPKKDCRADLVALGEVMLRFDPGDRRIWTTRHFEVSEGGGEYNVARGLKRCFGLETTIVTSLADNPVGRLLQDLIYQGGVDQSLVRWVEYDSVGRSIRNGLNFTERGFGVRAALGCSDRGHSAASQMKPGQIDWDDIFGRQGARWFHTGGIFCALSESTHVVNESSSEGSGMLDGGSLVGNETARVLSSIFSRISVLLFSSTGRSSGSRPLPGCSLMA